MRTRRYILLLLFCMEVITPLCYAIDIDYRASTRIGWIMPDGKVDVVTGQRDAWYGPTFSADLSITFRPNWESLRQWNRAGWGVGLSYWHLNHQLLGQAIAPYTYMDIALVRRPHFILGTRPAIGMAFMTKTYQNTVPEGHLYQDVTNANQCIGSVFNFYFPEAIYMDFPIVQGWAIMVGGGWYHISNGSIRQPNSGYNTFAAEIGVRYAPTTQENTVSAKQEDKTTPSIHRAWDLELSFTGGGRQVYYKDQQTFFVSELQLAAYWRAHSIFRLGGGIDAFYDGAYTPRTTDFRKTNLAAAQKGDCWRVGVSLQPEFVIGNLTAGFHLGAYLYDPVKELEPADEAQKSVTGRIHRPIFYKYDILKAGSAGYPDGWLYTQVVLRYHLPWHIFIQGTMKSHITKVEFMSLGIGVYY